MNKRKISLFLIGISVLLGFIQLFISCQFSLYGEKLAFLEKSIRHEEEKRAKITLQIAQKTKIEVLADFAKKNGFKEKSDTIVLLPHSSFAYNW